MLIIKWWGGRQPPTGKRSDQGPPASLAFPSAPPGEHRRGERLQRVTERGGLRPWTVGKHLRIELGDPFDTPAAQPLKMVPVTGPPQPTTHGRAGPAQASSNAPMAVPGGLGGHRGPDDLGGVSQSRLAPRGQQHPRGPAVPAPATARPHRRGRAVQPAHPPSLITHDQGRNDPPQPGQPIRPATRPASARSASNTTITAEVCGHQASLVHHPPPGTGVTWCCRPQLHHPPGTVQARVCPPAPRGRSLATV